jgi:hypothetical protein
MSRYGMPTKRQLISYYSGDSVDFGGETHNDGEAWMEENGVENYLFISDTGATCMACGFYHGIQRCHILPLCEGGDNSLKNIHLLCRNCHSESEFLSGEAYWKWMRHVNTTRYVCWASRVLEKIEMETGKPSTGENVAEYWRQKLRRGEVLV